MLVVSEFHAYHFNFLLILVNLVAHFPLIHYLFFPFLLPSIRFT